MSITRRQWLRGVGGVALGLPYLEGLARAQAGSSGIRRFGVFFCCNGVEMSRWFPRGEYGALTEAHLLGTSNEALLPLLPKLLFLRGVHMTPRGYGRDPGSGDDHGQGMAHKLTAYPAEPENWLARGPSVDHVIAAEVNHGQAGSRQPPLNLMVGRPVGFRSLDYISYSQAERAVQAISNPWDAYAQMINLDGRAPGTEQARLRLEERRESVLDLVRDQFDRLRHRRLSTEDHRKLDLHFTNIRETEARASEVSARCEAAAIERRASAYQGNQAITTLENQYPAIAELQVDILALALACDHTRVATLHFDRGSGGPTFAWDGMRHEYNHHKLSHGKVRDDCLGASTANGCDDVDGYQDMLFDIDRWHQRKLLRLLQALDSYTEEEGRTVLDNSAILYTNEMSDGSRHSYMDLPYLVAGSLGGVLKQGQYLSLGDEGQTDRSAPHNQLLNTFVNAMGIASPWFGLPEGMGGPTMRGGVIEALFAS